MSHCPCGSAKNVDDCCAPLIAGALAPTAEALMRSRYTAFVLRQLDHVERTHAPEIREDFNRAEAERVAEECEWKGLEVRRVHEVGDLAEIDFAIRFRRDQKPMIQAERAHFRREDGQWLYVKSDFNPEVTQRHVTKVGRNEPCPCGSGKKAKKCCGTTTDAD